MKDRFCPRSQIKLGPELGLLKSPKELSRALSIVPLPLQGENLPEMTENLGALLLPPGPGSQSRE